MSSSLLNACRCFITSTLTTTLFLYEAIAYNIIWACRILPVFGDESRSLPSRIAFNVLWGLAVWSYIAARVASPGSVPNRWFHFVRETAGQLQVESSRSEWQPGKATYCVVCKAPRPERAHHCRVCDRCVLRMDHHCPWLNNCVGIKNHKFFILSLLYGAATSVVALATTCPELLKCFQLFVHLAEGDPEAQLPRVSNIEMGLFLLFGLVALICMSALSTLLAAHLDLCTSNATTIESHYDNMRNPFDQGGIFTNIAQIFGRPGPDWFFPIKPWTPNSDGITFKRTDIISNEWVDDEGKILSGEQVWRYYYNVPNPSNNGFPFGDMWPTSLSCTKKKGLKKGTENETAGATPGRDEVSPFLSSI